VFDNQVSGGTQAPFFAFSRFLISRGDHMGERYLYDKDLAIWGDLQAKLIRDGNWEALDYPAIADELESIRASQKRALTRALADLCFCIALHRSHPETETWCYVQAAEAGGRIETVLGVSPSLEDHARDFLDEAWSIAVGRVDEMFPGSTVHPEALGYTFNALRNRAFVPELERPNRFAVVNGNGGEAREAAPGQ
jgi:hypothetical protein